MRVLLIGAHGYLGRYVADRLLADPAVTLTALGRGDDADVRFDLSTGSPGALTRFLDAVHPGVVINCAGAVRGGARELTRHNTVGAATVCEALRRSSCSARLVHIGAGQMLSPRRLSVRTLAGAIRRAIEQPGYRIAARSVAAEMASEGGAATAAAAITAALASPA